MKPILVAALVALAGCSSSQTFEPIEGPGPSWSFKDTTGATHDQDSAKGKPTLMFFMATWCPKCQATAPTLAKVQDARADVNFYSVTWDPQEDNEDLQRWMTKYDQPWPHGVDPGSSIARTFGVTSQSSLIILDADGQMTKRWLYANPSEKEILDALDAA